MNIVTHKENEMGSRNLVREKAKKIYKEQAKGVPKNKRITFAQFFKQYKAIQASPGEADPAVEEDFDFDDMVNVTNISEPEPEIEE